MVRNSRCSGCFAGQGSGRFSSAALFFPPASLLFLLSPTSRVRSAGLQRSLQHGSQRHDPDQSPVPLPKRRGPFPWSCGPHHRRLRFGSKSSIASFVQGLNQPDRAKLSRRSSATARTVSPIPRLHDSDKQHLGRAPSGMGSLVLPRWTPGLKRETDAGTHYQRPVLRNSGAFMAPEQVWGNCLLDRRTDKHGMARDHYILAGRLPFLVVAPVRRSSWGAVQ